MIVPMQKVMIAASAAKREEFLSALREGGLVHLIPVEPDAATPEEQTRHALDNVHRAVQVLSMITPDADAEIPGGSADALIHATLHLHRTHADKLNRLSTLQRQVEQLGDWGNAALADIESLDADGLTTTYAWIPVEDATAVKATFATVLTTKDKGKLALIAIVGDSPTLPESARVLERPNRDRAKLTAEAAEIETQLRAINAELSILAHALDVISARQAELQSVADFQSALGGALDNDGIFAVQGWVPKRAVDSILPALEAKSIHAAINTIEPADDEAPPSLVEYPAWVRPIKALFGILGTIPGYREFDPSMVFMLAMPIFTAMLIGDAGYGLIFAAAGFFARKKLRTATGDSAAGSMITIFGLATVVYGVLTGNYFGVTPWDMASAGGLWESLGNGLKPLASLVALDANHMIDPDATNQITLKLCFALAGLQLVLAHLIQAIRTLPNQKGIAELGWSVFLTGMTALVWVMFFKTLPFGLPDALPLWCLLGGFAMVVLFSVPAKNPVTRIGMGILTNLMPTINTFGDTLSYIRLMAVGMASFYMAAAFNGLAVQIGSAGAWAWIFAALILLAAHGLNIFLCIIAVLAHGVRLNLLEFSGNAGIEWAGYAYQPFAETNKA